MEFQSQVEKDEDEDAVAINIKAEPSRLEARYLKRYPSAEDTDEKEVSGKKCNSDMACVCYRLNRSRSADDFLFGKADLYDKRTVELKEDHYKLIKLHEEIAKMREKIHIIDTECY
ncbi:uncharacterized protein LOC123292849 [Chrysoperla carnea]|uniref:uncharacterized protein LOC123292849 n=1 Tax=Chrysoperla carnea TaxID=189513 RepID=UPI001D06850A|nr:uncharacterized protein LOC123292849 [Chrysoperla carnea]